MKTEKPTPPEGYTPMSTDKPSQSIGISNPTSAFDPFGVFMEPKEGWASVGTSKPMGTDKPSQSISEEAATVVAGDRADDYGDVNESFARIAKLWSTYTGTTVSPWDVAQMMILLKVSRAKTSTKRDTLVDIAGYAECAGQLKQTD